MTSYGLLSRMTQFKDKSKQMDEKGDAGFISAGLFACLNPQITINEVITSERVWIASAIRLTAPVINPINSLNINKSKLTEAETQPWKIPILFR